MTATATETETESKTARQNLSAVDQDVCRQHPAYISTILDLKWCKRANGGTEAPENAANDEEMEREDCTYVK